MGRATPEEKAKYQESIREYKEKVETIKVEADDLARQTKVKNDPLANYRRILAANKYLQVITLYCNMSDVSMELLHIKNENYLNEARKFLYKVLILLEEVVTPYIDVPLSELEEHLQTIPKINPKRKLNLIRKIGYNISLIEDGFGENSKWKWSYVEMEGRHANIIKNLIDYRALQANNDPRRPYFVERNALLKMAKEKLMWAAKRYREKYEISTREPGDIKKAIDYLNALRRIHILFNENDDAQNCKRTAELFDKQMNIDIKKKEAERKRQKGGGKKRRR